MSFYVGCSVLEKGCGITEMTIRYPYKKIRTKREKKKPASDVV